MELLPGFRTIGCALLFRKTLVLSDLHLGYEKALGAGTGFISRFQFDELIRELDWVFRVAGKLDAIVLNGDIKHEFGTIEEREWRYVLRFLDYLQKHAKRIILIKGNHDTLLKPIAEKRSYPLEPFVLLHDVLITHGDEITNEFKKAAKKAKTIVIGHEHPAVTLRKGSRSETFKCFLAGKWKRNKMIVLPSANPLTQGTDILSSGRLSPFLGSLSSFRAFLVGEEGVYDFGKVSNLARAQRW
ncbi:metallophosphoesterase [Candidatus Woesearchaeota archaeon]|nr:metallophosphoesterase [Candidatus Woesearchaeota archaeon]